MIFYYIYKLGQAIVMALPLKAAYKVAVFLSDLHYLFAYKDRFSVMANLKAIFPDKTATELKRIRLAMFRNFAKYLVDFFRFEKLTKENLGDYMNIEGVGFIDQALKKGKGAIVLSAHIGNWEMGGVGMALAGYSIGAVALPHRHKAVDDFFNSQREGKGMKVIPVGKAIRECLILLKENKLLALLGDRGFGEKGMLLDFFGKQTALPKGPAAISIRSGAALVPGFVYRNKDETCTLKFEKAIEFTPSGDKDADIKALIVKYKSVIEDYIRKYPDQWFVFPTFWVG
ncbi:MAG: lysophospholipid acyltransferase family protein [Candidatus Omnitrophica bacterium]|nr:lysophospholipid acyltransferase family protein [Candidatus Omnitrophota bacterium]MDD5655151.1 lysophospholipid acyltransferase family protein [Candidatus Omnitrophota bacterium]